MVNASGSRPASGVRRLVPQPGCHTYPVEDFSFYQEGGVAGTIRGESVILGRSDFMAQMGVRLPREIKLPTGVFLAVDRELVAVFAIKYMASDNVDAARRQCCTTVSARCLPCGISISRLRSSSVSSRLIPKSAVCIRSFLTGWLFSEEEHESSGRPAALLFREGLMPYAETVVGGKRMYGAVRKNVPGR